MESSNLVHLAFRLCQAGYHWMQNVCVCRRETMSCFLGHHPFSPCVMHEKHLTIIQLDCICTPPLVFILATRYAAYWKMKAVRLGWVILPSPFQDILLICFDFFSSLPIHLSKDAPWNLRKGALLKRNLRGISTLESRGLCQEGPGSWLSVWQGEERNNQRKGWGSGKRELLDLGLGEERIGWGVPCAVPRCMGSKGEGWWDATRSGGIATACSLNCRAAWQQPPWPSDELPSGTNQNVNKTPPVAKSISLDINQKSQQSIMCYWITIRIQW